MLRLSFLGSLTPLFLAALGGNLAAHGPGASPPPDPQITFVERTSKNIYVRVMNADGSNVQTVVTGGRNDSIQYPCWSPDGTRLAFLATLSASTGLWVVNLNGTGRQRIRALNSIFGAYVDWSPIAAPDGSDKLVFNEHFENPHSSDVFVINPDGSGLQLLETVAAIPYTCWNWDATALVFIMDDVVIWDLAAAAGGGLTVTGETWLPHTPGYKGKFRAANTSDRIVNHCMWLGGPPNINGLQILDLTTNPPTTTQVTNAGENNGSFSPDDTRLVYGRNSRIYTSAADGTDERLIRAPAAGNNSSVHEPYWKHN